MLGVIQIVGIADGLALIFAVGALFMAERPTGPAR
jgi:hypothetical protein